MENYGSTLEKGVNMKGKGSVLEAKSQHGRQRVNTEYKKSKWKILSQQGDKESKWKTMGQHCSQRVDMEGEGLILETRVNKKDRGQHLRQGIKNGNKESTLETRGQKGWQAVNIRSKEPT